MKDRLLTLALAIGAFAAFYALLAPKPAPPQERPTRPLSTEPGPNGYLGLQRWLAAAHVKTVSLRERYGKLEEAAGAAAPTGNLLITTTPHFYPLRDSEAAPLRAWISSGNTLLVAAGLSDTPEWSMGEGADRAFMAHMNLMTGLTFAEVPPDRPGGKPASAGEGSKGDPQSAAKPDARSKGNSQSTPKPDAGSKENTQPAAKPDEPSITPRDALAAFQKLAEPERFELVPNGVHPLLDGVQSAIALSEYPSAKWRAVSTSGSLVLELAHDPASGVPVLWLLPYGNGQVIVSAYGSIFTNKLLGQHDNARLLANIASGSLGPGGQVIIDDAHQGLVAFYDPEAFFGDTRLHRSLWWLLGLWLVLVLGPQRLRAAASSWNPVDVTSFVRATGGFMARVLKPATAGRQLFANFFNELRRRIGLPLNGAPVWEWLEVHAGMPAGDFTQLQDLHSRATHGRRIDLPKLQNLLVQIRTKLN